MKRRNPFITLLTLIGLGISLGIGVTVYLFIVNPFQETPMPILETFVPESNTMPSAGATMAGSFPHILIPAAQVDAMIVPSRRNTESWEIDHLGMNVGHLEGTAWLNEPGNIALAGHVDLADGRPGIFARIDRVQPGDIVMLTENGVEYQYVVIEVRTVMPTDMSAIAPTERPRVTLITCSDYDFSINNYKTRLIVIAERL